MKAAKQENAERKTMTMGLRVSGESRDRIGKLADLLGRELGTRISLSQAVDIAVKETLKRREVAN